MDDIIKGLECVIGLKQSRIPAEIEGYLALHFGNSNNREDFESLKGNAKKYLENIYPENLIIYYLIYLK